ncbi:hypothetical protein [Streptomyces griseicoloratus]|uniref:hypothetical protein n=1 Tax=Streptomyces griseicoloratus TaxID=2752516 RepID=UPI001CB6E71A|nr:hypothetical protein [Streptomyces griseicoloratus]
MSYEIRRYQARPGRSEEWVRYVEDVVVPFQALLGMDVTASFVDVQLWHRMARQPYEGKRGPRRWPPT